MALHLTHVGGRLSSPRPHCPPTRLTLYAGYATISTSSRTIACHRSGFSRATISRPRRLSREPHSFWVNFPQRPASGQRRLAELEAVWKLPRGLSLLTAVNNTYIGLFYLAAALMFFILAGILALLMRLQLAVPENTLIEQGFYNQLFTMHGTVMMFLFAVPVVEAIGILLLPQMQAARDLPFLALAPSRSGPTYRRGSSSVVSFGWAPDGGWLCTPPLKITPPIFSDQTRFLSVGIGLRDLGDRRRSRSSSASCAREAGRMTLTDPVCAWGHAGCSRNACRLPPQ